MYRSLHGSVKLLILTDQMFPTIFCCLLVWLTEPATAFISVVSHYKLTLFCFILAPLTSSCISVINYSNINDQLELKVF